MSTGAAASELSPDAYRQARDDQRDAGTIDFDSVCFRVEPTPDHSGDKEAREEHDAPRDITGLFAEDASGDSADAGNAPVEHEKTGRGGADQHAPKRRCDGCEGVHGSTRKHQACQRYRTFHAQDSLGFFDTDRFKRGCTDEALFHLMFQHVSQ